MLLTEYNAKRHIQNTYEEGLRRGRFEGLEQGRFEGLEQGRAEGNAKVMRMIRLNQKLIQDNRLEDLKRVLEDDGYREELLEKYKI